MASAGKDVRARMMGEGWARRLSRSGGATVLAGVAAEGIAASALSDCDHPIIVEALRSDRQPSNHGQRMARPPASAAGLILSIFVGSGIFLSRGGLTS